MNGNDSWACPFFLQKSISIVDSPPPAVDPAVAEHLIHRFMLGHTGFAATNLERAAGRCVHLFDGHCHAVRANSLGVKIGPFGCNSDIVGPHYF